MDYTSSNSYATDVGTAQRMHLQAQATPTAVSDTDLNGLIWEVMEVIKAGGVVPAAFDKTVPGTYTQLRDAIAVAVRLQSAAYASAGGTANALTAVYAPAVPALVNGLTLYVRAASANTTTTPTFSPNGLTAKTIVKGANRALEAGDIDGAGHWLELQYDATLGKWVLLNPATGASLLPLFGSVKAASGYQKLPSGLIIQWMSGPICSTEGSTYSALSFPITFPVACLIAIASTKGDDTVLSDQIFQVSSWTTSSVKLFPQWFGTGTQGLCYPLVIAIGY